MRLIPFIEGLWLGIMQANLAWHTITGADEMKWNDMKEMSMEKWWNQICGGENGRNPEKNLPRLRFIHHENHIMEWQTRTRDPGGGRPACNRLHQGAENK